MLRTITYKLKPSKAQTKELQRVLDESRNIYNKALEQLISVYKETNHHMSRFEQDKFFNKETCPNLHSHIVDATLDRVHRSFKNFFGGRKNGRKVGFPRFKSYNRWHSFEFKDWISGRIIKNKFHLSRNCKIKLKLYQPIPGKPKFTRVLKKPSGWYVQVICEIENNVQPIVLNKSKSVGIDVGIKYFLADSNKNLIQNPKLNKQFEHKLKINNRKFSKKKRGSKRREKQKKILGKTYEKLANKRKDFLHKISRTYADQYDLICVEDLKIENMVRNKNLSKSILDCSWSHFFNLLQYKLETLGKKLIKVEPRGTSQRCSRCNEIIKKSLSQRTHICTKCGFVEDRDINASLNILKLGLDQAFGEDTSLEDLMTREVLIN